METHQLIMLFIGIALIVVAFAMYQTNESDGFVENYFKLRRKALARGGKEAYWRCSENMEYRADLSKCFKKEDLSYHHATPEEAGCRYESKLHEVFAFDHRVGMFDRKEDAEKYIDLLTE